MHRPGQLSLISGALPILLLAVGAAAATGLLVRRDRRHLVRTVPVLVLTAGADPRTGHADLHADVREETTMSSNRTTTWTRPRPRKTPTTATHRVTSLAWSTTWKNESSPNAARRESRETPTNGPR